MNKEKIRNKIEILYKDGIQDYQNKDYDLAYSKLKQAYKICIKVRDIEYLPMCAELLKDICYELATEYVAIALKYTEHKLYDEAMRNLKYGYNAVYFAKDIEVPYHETKNVQLLEKIKGLIITTNEHRHAEFVEGATEIIEATKNLVSKCAAGLAKATEAAGKVIGAVADWALESNDKPSSSSPDTTENISPKEKAESLYDLGENSNDPFSALNYYKECFDISRKANLDTMINRCCFAISYIYESLGDEEFDTCEDGDTMSYVEKINSAISYYEKAKSWYPDYPDHLMKKIDSVKTYDHNRLFNIED